MRPNIKLHIYKGEWGLPSVDLECLQALCAIKFTEAPIEINIFGNPFLSNNGKLPYLQDDNDGSKKNVGSRKIIKYLEEKGYSINSRLTKDLQFLSDAYNTVIFNNLHPCFYYIIFGDPQNIEKTRAIYAKRTPFPFNFYYPGRLTKYAEDILQVFGGFSIYDKKENHDSEEIILNAKQCVNMLSTKLGNKKWFFGDKPSDLDVNVYSYLSLLYYIQLPFNPIQLHLRECPNLLKFINRITKEYFSAESFNTELQENENKNKNSTANTDSRSDATILTPSEKEFLESKRKTQILAFLGAFFAMSTYAAWIGLIRVSVKGEYDDDDEFLYDDHDDDDSTNSGN